MPPIHCRTRADDRHATGNGRDPPRLGSADRYRALLHDALGEHDLADKLFAAAVEQHEAFRTPPWIARTHLDWAESVIARGLLDDARTHLDAARAAIGDLDLPDNQRRLDALASQL